MSDDFVRKALESALEKIAVLGSRRLAAQKELETVEKERAKLAVKIVSLARLCDDLPEDSDLGQMLKETSELGLTEGIKVILKASDEALTTIQIRDALIRLGFDLNRYRNALAAINTVLTRLPFVEVTKTSDQGKASFKWKDLPTSPFETVAKLPPKEAKKLIKNVAKGIVSSGNSAKTKKQITEKKTGNKDD